MSVCGRQWDRFNAIGAYETGQCAKPYGHSESGADFRCGPPPTGSMDPEEAARVKRALDLVRELASDPCAIDFLARPVGCRCAPCRAREALGA